MEKPLISFIITYYNLPVSMLKECIDSILALTLRPFEREIIIVDDGSDVSPMNELMAYGHEIIYMRLRHHGLSTARNNGIRMAQGDYLQFIDGDDKLLQTPYEQCLDIVRYHQPDMVLFRLTHSAVVQTNIQYNDPVSGVDYMRKNNIRGSACGYILRSGILGELRFTPGIWHEDEEFTPLLMIRAERVYATDAQAYYYRRRTNSISTDNGIRHRLKKLNDAKNVILRLTETADRLPTNDRIAMQRRTAQLTMDYLYNVIRHTRSRHYLNRCIEDLHKHGLFPLPKRSYTTKYKWFRRLTNSNFGLSLLMWLVPILGKEK